MKIKKGNTYTAKDGSQLTVTANKITTKEVSWKDSNMNDFSGTHDEFKALVVEESDKKAPAPTKLAKEQAYQMRNGQTVTVKERKGDKVAIVEEDGREQIIPAKDFKELVKERHFKKIDR